MKKAVLLILILPLILISCSASEQQNWEDFFLVFKGIRLLPVLGVILFTLHRILRRKAIYSAGVYASLSILFVQTPTYGAHFSSLDEILRIREVDPYFLGLSIFLIIYIILDIMLGLKERKIEKVKRKKEAEMNKKMGSLENELNEKPK